MVSRITDTHKTIFLGPEGGPDSPYVPEILGSETAESIQTGKAVEVELTFAKKSDGKISLPLTNIPEDYEPPLLKIAEGSLEPAPDESSLVFFLSAEGDIYLPEVLGSNNSSIQETKILTPPVSEEYRDPTENPELEEELLKFLENLKRKTPEPQESKEIELLKLSTDAFVVSDALRRKKSGELSYIEADIVRKYKTYDTLLRIHEDAHLIEAREYALGNAIYHYRAGPDGKLYAYRGCVDVDVKVVPNDPNATRRKARVLRKAATGVFDPSPADLAVASKAALMEMYAIGEERYYEYRDRIEGKIKEFSLDHLKKVCESIGSDPYLIELLHKG